MDIYLYSPLFFILEKIKQKTEIKLSSFIQFHGHESGKGMNILLPSYHQYQE